MPHRAPRSLLPSSQVVGAAAAASLLAFLPSCSSSKRPDRDNRGAFEVVEVSTGSAPVYPYRIRQLDPFGQPTNEILEIRSMDDLRLHAADGNQVLPTSIFADGPPTLPDGRPGNQFLEIGFSHDLDADSILSTDPGASTNSHLRSSIAVLAYDVDTEQIRMLEGRAFVGGSTIVQDGTGTLHLVQAIVPDGAGDVRRLTSFVDADGVTRPIPASVHAGFPSGFHGADRLASAKRFVFVADEDDDLTTFESFPDAGTDKTLLRIAISNAVLDTSGHVLEEEVCTVTSVGVDPRPPEVLGFLGGTPAISPGNGDRGVDPATTMLVRFNKPVQPADVGTFFDPSNLAPTGGGATIGVSLAARSFNVPYYATPVAAGDLCNYVLRPAYHLPGKASVTVAVNQAVVRSLTSMFLGNTVQTAFETGQGTGIVNAPVAPDALYVGMVGSRPGLKIVDLNGFGQTTGGYHVDPAGNTPPVFDWRATTRFQHNPNIGQLIVPSLSKPNDLTASGLDAGSPGVFRLVQDSAGETLLLGAPVLGSVADIHIGCPLDIGFNNANINVNASNANHLDAFGGTGIGNGFSIVPHPNPPPLVFPPPNNAMGIHGQEPTATNTACVQQALNLLVSGNPEGVPPNVGIFGHALDIFNGPAPRPGSPPPPTPYCPFGARQQIGHFLYVLDGDNKQILVVNSNRMRVLDTIRTSDPVDLAMSPDLRHLAVSNQSSGTIAFVDIDPTSPTFHQVTGETKVPSGPGKIVWQPDGEDILVLHPQDSALTVVNAIDRQVTKRVRGQLDNPIDLVVTDRHLPGRGNATGLYFAYILNRNGTVAIFESGPDGGNGIGFNDIIGTVPDVVFPNPAALSIDLTSVLTGVYVSHRDERGRGMVSRLEMTVSSGQQPLSPNQNGFLLPPTYRQKIWRVTQRFGGGAATGRKDQLSGTPGELATDEMMNFADLPNQTTPRMGVPPTSPFGGSEKGHLKNGLAAVPKFLFVAIVDRGVIDVFDVTTAEKVRTIELGGIPAVLSSYWRQ